MSMHKIFKFVCLQKDVETMDSILTLHIKLDLNFDIVMYTVLVTLCRFNHPIEVSNKQTTPAQQEMKDFEFAKQEVQRVQEAR